MAAEIEARSSPGQSHESVSGLRMNITAPIWGARHAIDRVPWAALRSPWAIFTRSLRDSVPLSKQNEGIQEKD